VAARYDIITAAENSVTVVASSGSFDRLGHASTVGGPTMFARIGVMRHSTVTLNGRLISHAKTRIGESGRGMNSLSLSDSRNAADASLPGRLSAAQATGAKQALRVDRW
jgi:hypothetical protein